MSERSKETVLKTVEGNLREFESRPVRLSGSEFSRDPLFYMRFRAVCCMRFLQTLSCGLLQAFTGFYARCRVCVAARSALYVGVRMSGRLQVCGQCVSGHRSAAACTETHIE